MKKQNTSRSPVIVDPDDPLVGTRMRVWWAPTDDKAKTGFAGAYWPVLVLGRRSTDKYFVEYDNGEREDVLTEHLAPDDPPVDYGQEVLPLEPGEFCEVSNDSKTDPCSWVAMVSKRLPGGDYLITYPFHDSDDERVPPHLIRRARILETDGWALLRPKQHWTDGDVLSPHELESIKEEELGNWVNLSGSQQAKVKPEIKREVKGAQIKPETKGKRPASTTSKTPERPSQKPRV